LGYNAKKLKKINMKQLISLFLFLLPCLAWAQYPSNGNQKITLGEQTTADGLIYRGVAATDTVRKPSIDTMAYMVLDTTTNIIWHYKKATSNAWLRLNLLPSDTASMLTPYFRKLDTTNIKYVNTYGTQTVNGAKTISGVTIFSNTSDAGNASSAPVTFLGGVGIAKNLRVGGSIVADGPNLSIATLNGGDMQFYNTGNNQFGRILSTAGSGGNIRFQANGSTNVLDLGSTGLATIYNLAGGTNNRAVLADVNGSLSAPSTPLPVANGGTGASSFSPNNYLIRTNSSGIFDTSAVYEAGGNVGIGTATPTQALHVVGNGLFTGYIGSNINPLNTFVSYVSAGNNYMQWVTNPTTGTGTGSTDGLRIGLDGISNAIIDNNEGTNLLIKINGNTIYTINASGNNTWTGTATFSNLAGINDVGADANGKLQAATSDMNLKNTIENSPFGLNEILLLNPVTFLYNDLNRKLDSDVKEVGFIAQDVFDIIPNAISSTGTGDLQLDYRAITATLTKAIQEQQALIKALEQRIINLENK